MKTIIENAINVLTKCENFVENEFNNFSKEDIDFFDETDTRIFSISNNGVEPFRTCKDNRSIENDVSLGLANGKLCVINSYWVYENGKRSGHSYHSKICMDLANINTTNVYSYYNIDGRSTIELADLLVTNWSIIKSKIKSLIENYRNKGVMFSTFEP